MNLLAIRLTSILSGKIRLTMTSTAIVFLWLEECLSIQEKMGRKKIHDAEFLRTSAS
jgi:hypothetical protein